ncbi:MAG: hypothetical protein FH758_13645 [Firmicutes bacterium]|nr:hypothetical protein [Bacillota bacterium]
MAQLVACYIRVSTDEQAEQGLSIPAQKSRLMAYSKSQGWELYDFFIDDGYSGKDLERPGIKRVIQEANDKNFDILLVLKLDRLSRRQKDVLYVLEDVLESNNIGFKSATESFETTTPFGKAALGMMAVFAQLERETIVERIRIAKKESAKQGRFMGGPVPYGYRYNFKNKTMEIDDIQAKTIRWIYDQYIEGSRGYMHIGEELERQGVPGPTDMRWNKVCIRNILTNPVYAGFTRHEGELYPGKHEAIIELKKWQEVQTLINSRGAIRAAAAVHTGLISGIVWCGECSARMRVKNVWQNYPCKDPKRVIRYYVCYSQDGSSKHMVRDPSCRCGYKNADLIERKVIKELHNYSFDQELLRQVIDEALTKETNQKTILRAINQANKEYSAIEKKINRWYDAFENGAIEAEELTERVKELRKKRSYYNKQIVELEEQIKEEVSRQTSAEEIIEMFKKFPVIWEAATQDERREIVVNLIKEVQVYKNDQVKVTFNL